MQRTKLQANWIRTFLEPDDVFTVKRRIINIISLLNTMKTCLKYKNIISETFKTLRCFHYGMECHWNVLKTYLCWSRKNKVLWMTTRRLHKEGHTDKPQKTKFVFDARLYDVSELSKCLLRMWKSQKIERGPNSFMTDKNIRGSV